MAGKFGLLILTDRIDAEGLRAELRAALELLGTPGDGGGGGGGGPFPPGHVETQTDGQGRIVVPEGTAPQELSDAIRKHWPRELWGDVARISYYESSWKATATNDTRHLAGGQCGQRYWLASAGIWANTEYSVGYMQINICAHGADAEWWYNADHNLKGARNLYDARGGTFEDWLYTAGRLGLL